MPVIC
jgi:hypothetical protein